MVHSSTPTHDVPRLGYSGHPREPSEPQFHRRLVLFFLVLPVYCYQPISLHPHAHMLSHVTPRTAAHQALLSMDFSRQEYWIGLPFPSPRLLKERAPSLPSPPREGVWAMLSSKKTDGMHHEVRRRVGQCIRAFGTHWL